MSDYTPTTEEVIETLEHNGLIHRANYGIVRLQRADLMRWLERQREEAFQDGRIEERDRARAEQGEPEGQRWYAACWQDDNGILNALESDTILREYAEADVKRWRDAEQREEGGRPDLVVLGTKLRFPWLPVEESRTDGSER